MNKKSKMLSLALLVAIAATATPLKVHAATQINRVSGKDRYETAAKIASSGWTNSSVAILATGLDYPDALCATPLAKKYNNAPILLVQKDSLDQTGTTMIADELKSLGVTQAIIVGGTGVISAKVEAQLDNMKITHIRLAGQDRYETSLKIAQAVLPSTSMDSNSEVVVTTGENFPDALSIAPIAASKGIPIILSSSKGIDADTMQYLSAKPKSYLIGGSAVVPDSVQANFSFSERISGKDRFDTNVQVMKRFEGDLDFSKAYMATGNDFPDALSGSALASKTVSPIILSDKILSKVTGDYLSTKMPSIGDISVLGGDGAVSTSNIEDINYTDTDNTLLGNMINGGIAARHGQWIYELDQKDGYIYKESMDGSSRSLLIDDNAVFITTSGQYVYYLGFSADTPSIYRINDDGTGRTAIKSGNIGNFAILGDWIYYTEFSTDGTQATIGKIKTDGTGDVKFSTGGLNLNVDNNSVYFIKDGHITSISAADGSNETQINNDMVFKFQVVGSSIYYVNEDDNEKLYVINTDGTGKKKVLDKAVTSFNVSDGWIYYSDGTTSSDGKDIGGSKIYKIKTDGTENTKLNDEVSVGINIVGGWIYYINVKGDSEFYLVKIRTNGTSRQLLK